jgi:hypothetical protein
LDVAAGLGVTQRTMQYQKGLADVYEYPLLPHTGFTTITLRLGAHWYPGTYFYKDGVLPNIGLAMNLYRSVGGSTQVKDGMGEVSKFDTTFTEFNIGVRGRLQLKGIELGLNGGWGTQSLVLDGDNETPTGAMEKDPGIIPDAGYSYFRFGPDVHFELGAPIEAGLFYRMVTLDDEEGYLKEARWFPNAAAIGLDAFAQVNIALTKKIQLQLGGEARYYGVKANPGVFADTTDGTGNATPGAQGQPGLTRAVAAGVSDVYLGAFASAYFTMPGTAH